MEFGLQQRPGLDERTPLTKARGGKIYPEPLSLEWRIFHNINYLIGGITFAIGSYQYFPGVSDFVLGGWLFTIGSAGFMIADGLEWWKNNRVGCFHYEEFEESYEAQVGPYVEPKSTFAGWYQRAEVGLNFFTSFCGSTLYLIGSILYIPALDTIVLGDKVFIVGSCVIFFAQAWKLYRAGTINEHNPSDRSFQISNYYNDLWAFLVDLTAGLGGAAYFIGSIYFLPAYDVSEDITYLAAWWFQVGGVLFFLSGFFMFFRYFIFGRF
jgi:hypothetical protein